MNRKQRRHNASERDRKKRHKELRKERRLKEKALSVLGHEEFRHISPMTIAPGVPVGLMTFPSILQVKK